MTSFQPTKPKVEVLVEPDNNVRGNLGVRHFLRAQEGSRVLVQKQQNVSHNAAQNGTIQKKPIGLPRDGDAFEGKENFTQEIPQMAKNQNEKIWDKKETTSPYVAEDTNIADSVEVRPVSPQVVQESQPDETESWQMIKNEDFDDNIPSDVNHMKFPELERSIKVPLKVYRSWPEIEVSPRPHVGEEPKFSVKNTFIHVYDASDNTFGTPHKQKSEFQPCSAPCRYSSNRAATPTKKENSFTTTPSTHETQNHEVSTSHQSVGSPSLSESNLRKAATRGGNASSMCARKLQYNDISDDQISQNNFPSAECSGSSTVSQMTNTTTPLGGLLSAHNPNMRSPPCSSARSYLMTSGGQWQNNSTGCLSSVVTPPVVWAASPMQFPPAPPNSTSSQDWWTTPWGVCYLGQKQPPPPPSHPPVQSAGATRISLEHELFNNHRPEVKTLHLQHCLGFGDAQMLSCDEHILDTTPTASTLGLRNDALIKPRQLEKDFSQAPL